MSESFNRDLTLPVPCGKCGYEIQETIRRIEQNPKLTCPQCGTVTQVDADDRKPSREDVLARWIARALPDIQWKILVETPNREYPAARGTIGIISKGPCGRCNNTWMAALEARAKLILTPLILGGRAVITPEQQAVIVPWFVKTIMLLDVLYTHTQFFDEQQRRALATNLKVPEKIFCFIAGYHNQGPDIIRLHGAPLPFGYVSPDGHPPSDPPIVIEGYTATIVIGYLVLQFLSIRNRSDRDKGDFRIRVPDSQIEQANVRIWPETGSNIPWPPNDLILGPGSFETFETRWLTAIR